jgi:hypothetical protein
MDQIDARTSVTTRCRGAIVNVELQKEMKSFLKKLLYNHFKFEKNPTSQFRPL